MADDQATPDGGMTASTTALGGARQTGAGIAGSTYADISASASIVNNATGAAAPSTPVAINGTLVPLGGTSISITMPDGKRVTSNELFSADGVTITRETAALGPSPIRPNLPGLTVPGGAADQFNDTIVISTGSGNDQVNVSKRADGTLDVEINGKQFHVTLGSTQDISIRTNDGNDVIHTADNVTTHMDVRSGAGNDSITTGQGNDRIDAGDGDDMVRSGGGRDDVFGNFGNDTIDAGDGHDQVQGGDGDDVLQGGHGRDFLDGGKGNDNLLGGSGNDILSGGLGDDSLLSQEGDDRVYTGSGNDTVTNNAGSDVVYSQSADDVVTAGHGATNVTTNVDLSTTPGSSIRIDPSASPEFRQRTEADLEFLRSSPEGRALLTQIDMAASSGKTVTLRELTYEHNGYTAGTSNGLLTTDASGNVIAGAGANATIEYNPSSITGQFPVSAVTLFHELSHAYNHVTGTMQSGTVAQHGHPDHGIARAELQATGLSNDGANYNFPGSSGPSTANPFNENSLRQEMGLPLRPSYGFSSPWDGGLGSPLAMAPASGGGLTLASTGDATLDRMLAAMQNGDTQSLREASAQLYDQNVRQFKEQGAADLAQQQAEVKPAQIASPQVEQTEQAAGGMRR